MNFLKTTIIGGLLFLVPVVVLVVVIGEAASIMSVIAEPMADLLPIDSIGGVALANIVALVILVVVCFLAGLVARTKRAQKLANTAESMILQRIPGYTMIKGITSAFGPEQTAGLKPVLVSLERAQRVGVEIERVGSDRIAVYFPGSPNAFSGIVQIVGADQVTPLDAPLMSVMDHAEQLGKGAHELLAAAQHSPERPS